jgi:hypothetical protein
MNKPCLYLLLGPTLALYEYLRGWSTRLAAGYINILNKNITQQYYIVYTVPPILIINGSNTEEHRL